MCVVNNNIILLSDVNLQLNNYKKSILLLTNKFRRTKLIINKLGIVGGDEKSIIHVHQRNKVLNVLSKECAREKLRIIKEIRRVAGMRRGK